MNISTPIKPDLRFNPLDFFNGLVEASGLLVDFRGRVTRSFTAQFEGEMLGEAVRIRESLTYNNGVREYRLWHIKPAGQGMWHATADGLLDGAMIVRDSAAAAQSRWTYAMEVPVSGYQMRFALEDIMTLVSPDRMVALTPMKKFGLKLAHIASEYHKVR